MKEMNNEYCFKLNEIGDILAYVVSCIESKEYIYSDVKAYTWGWVRGEGMVSNRMNFKGIVKKGRENCFYCINEDQEHVWQLERIAHLFNSTFSYSEYDCNQRAENETYLKTFKNSNFEYLDEFIELLESCRCITGEITPDKALILAQTFVGEYVKKQEKTKKKV